MKVLEELNLSEFKAWSGGKDTLETLTDNQIERVQEFIEECYPDGVEDLQLNDFLWFERDFIACDILGYEDWESLTMGESERVAKFLREQYAINGDIIDEYIEHCHAFSSGWSLTEDFEDWLVRYGTEILCIEFPDVDESDINDYMDGYLVAEFDKLQLVDGFREYLEQLEQSESNIS